MTSALDGDSARLTDCERDRDRRMRLADHARWCGRMRGSPATNWLKGGSAGGVWSPRVGPAIGALWHGSIPTAAAAARSWYARVGKDKTRTSPCHSKVGSSVGEMLGKVLWDVALALLLVDDESRHVRVYTIHGTTARTHRGEHRDVSVRNNSACRVGLLHSAGERLYICVQVTLESDVRRGYNRALHRPCRPNIAGEYDTRSRQCFITCSDGRGTTSI